jgi:hypothetical protein
MGVSHACMTSGRANLYRRVHVHQLGGPTDNSQSATAMQVYVIESFRQYVLVYVITWKLQCIHTDIG